MNIFVLNPPFAKPISRATRGPAVGRGGTLFYPYWLAYATGVLEDAGFDVALIDAIARRYSLDDVLRFARERAPLLTVMDISAPSLAADLETARRIKEATGNFIVAVGPHATAQSKEILDRCDAFDAVARGEYDYTLRDLASHIRDAKSVDDVAGLTIRRDGHIVDTSARPAIEDLDSLPFVSRVYKAHLRIEDYFYAANLHPEVAIISGRGCPYQCHWCLYPQTITGHKFRTRSVENFVEELAYIKKELPHVREVFIEDDTFTAYRDRVHAICGLIRRRNLRICWSANVRADVDLETLRSMRAAGCRLVLAGFESGNQAVLNAMKKGLRISQARQFARDVRKAGLMLHACFVAGGPHETRATLAETLRYALDLSPTTAQFCPLMVYPGTGAFEWARRNGYLVSGDFSNWITVDGTHNSQVSTPELSAGELTAFCDYARRKFYLRPSYLLRTTAWASTRPREWRRMARGARNVSRFLFRRGRRFIADA